MMTITIAGRLGRDPDLRHTTGGTSALNFSVAIDQYDPQAREKITEWVRVVVFGKRAESLANVLEKGSSVVVVGEGRLKEYNDKFFIEINANQIGLIGGKPSGQKKEEERPAKRSDNRAKSQSKDDVPF